MTTLDHVVVTCPPGFTGRQLLQRIDEVVHSASGPGCVLVHAAHVPVPADAVARLIGTCSAGLVGSASPVPSEAVDRGEVAVVALHDLLPPPPTVPLPCPDLCAFTFEALRSVGARPPVESDWATALIGLGQRLTDAGWRHVLAPGVGYRWSGAPEPVVQNAAWSPGAVRAVVAGQPGLAAHRTWVDSRVRPMSVVIDGGCVTDDVHNGTQVVVINLARALARARPDAAVSLAVHDRWADVARRLVGGEGVEVVGRTGGRRYDVVYRPYQAIDPSDVAWLPGAAGRIVVGQLDMIGFSNPSYHPSSALFHTVRNLQRRMMRSADAVTFISVFGRETAAAECPEIAPERLHVVGCGVDVAPGADSATPPPLADIGPFVACLSATFRHKNRGHAIRTFAAMCERHGYPGSLVVAGPEPYYGRSADDDAAILAGLAPDIAARVRAVGHVDGATKWWLLRHADLVLYPSVVEGFGLVPFEAAAVGTPSLSYDGTGLHEVLVSASALMSTWDPDAWADRASSIVAAPEEASRVVAEVTAAAARHAWSDVAARTWDAIDAALALPTVRPGEEGSSWSRVQADGHVFARTSRARHLVNRGRAVIARRAARYIRSIRT